MFNNSLINFTKFSILIKNLKQKRTAVIHHYVKQYIKRITKLIQSIANEFIMIEKNKLFFISMIFHLLHQINVYKCLVFFAEGLTYIYSYA